MALACLASACGEIIGAAPIDASACTLSCSGECVNPDNDPAHCGGCDPCQIENATAACVAGVCKLDTCLPNHCDVDGIGGCEVNVDFSKDPTNCGGCGIVCTSGTCSGGLCGRRVFITDQTFDANFPGLGGADAHCQNEADAQTSTLGATWKAWLADATGSPATRFTTGGFFFRLDGVVIANDFADLIDGTLDNAVLLTSKGIPAAGSGFCWTNVKAGGVADSTANCGNWTSTASSSVGNRGVHNATNVSWTQDGLQNCNPGTVAPAHLYCFEQ